MVSAECVDEAKRDGGGRFVPGAVGNPAGRNQFTYRRDFEAEIDRYLNEAPEGEKLSRGALLARRTVDRAMAGDEMAKDVLARVWPAVTKHALDAEQMPSKITFQWSDEKEPTE